MNRSNLRSALGWRPQGWIAMQQSLARPLTPYYLLLGATAMLTVLGLLMVFSSSTVNFAAAAGVYGMAKRQALWATLGIIGAFVAMKIPLKWWRKLAWPGLLLAIIALTLTVVGPLGRAVNGNQNWLAVGPVQVQPSEMAKLVLVVWCAHIFARKYALLHSWKHLLIPVVPVFGLVIGLILWGHDLGTALVFCAMLLALFWVVGVPIPLYVGTATTVGITVVALAVQSPARMKRIQTFLDPFSDFNHQGWQPGHGIMGLASGGITGNGIGASQQKWGNLPEAHTDFIFAVLGEELGLFTSLLVIGCFLVIGYCGLRIATETDEVFVRFAAVGITTWIMTHVVINIGMVLTLMPVIGLPLPLMSYGGSSLLTTLTAIGMLLGFARRVPPRPAGSPEPNLDSQPVSSTALVGAGTPQS